MLRVISAIVRKPFIPPQVPARLTPTMDDHISEATSSIVGEPHPGDDEGPLAGTLGVGRGLT